ncbi:type VI secretion system baseplate subunit TssG [Neptunomonas phycophila]|jgi:type VI secretion system protein ImpH|nr:type VI secretion system baseplate subunit TssG [Neptunomonas phycophila]
MLASAGRGSITAMSTVSHAMTTSALPDMQFFQLLRHLELTARKSKGVAAGAIGHDLPLKKEFADFAVIQSAAFPGSACTKIDRVDHGEFTQSKLHIACFGLTGPSGVMPIHYTELLSSRARQKDTALKTLLDGFNARSVSFLYRAWQKNRLPIMQEHLTRATVNRQVDPAKAMLKAYVGLAEGDKEKSIKTDTESLALYFSGYYSKRPRNAAGLSKIISRVLGCQVTLQQFYGRWFDLEPEQRNTIGCKNATLGKDFVIGSSVFEGSCSIRIQTAPVSLADFKSLQPGQPKFLILKELINLYVGQDYLIDLQVVLKGVEKPPFILANDTTLQDSLRLGEGLWLSAASNHQNVADAIYEVNR